MPFTLHAGLVFRRGARTFELVRELPDGRWSYEDCHTRQPGTIAKPKLLKAIWAADVVLVGQDNASPSDCHAAAPPLVAYDELNDTHLADFRLRMAYVTAIRQAHCTRGQRSAIKRLLPQIAMRLNDPKPPSSSTVMEWIRKFEKSQHAPQAVITGNARRTRTNKLHPEWNGW